ncbi:NAD(P)-dependent oxidoreductase [Candidatus Poribacteria bacterium]|nr:NAD(P)-dependent oxidoreductase [Candidatus Poribacteria bacterium]
MPLTSLSPEQLRENMADLHPRFTRDEAVAESARCLFCHDAPCTRACPTRIDIPKFIRQILHDNPLGAAETILDANILGGSCARACPTEVLCEGACVDNTLLNEPVSIGRLQRYATDASSEKNVFFFEAGKPTGKKVAVVGAGPAGLSFAHEARRRGHQAVLFERDSVPGGLNTLGIAPYKISTEFALTEVELVKHIGVELRLNSPVDAAKLEQLRKEYDAVFLGIGLGKTARLDIEGEDIEGVWEGLAFIRQQHEKPLEQCNIGRHVVVIGGGNTAIDCATEAVRLGAEKVTICYRRGQEDMSAYAYEQDLAATDGCDFEFYALPLRCVAKNGKLAGVEFIRAELDGEGRQAKLVPQPGTEFTIACDMAVKALGQKPLVDLLKAIPGLKLDAKGRIAVNPETFETSVPGLYAGGDCVNGGAEIVNAVQHGKLAARAIPAS